MLAGISHLLPWGAAYLGVFAESATAADSLIQQPGVTQLLGKPADPVLVAVASGKKQMLDRELFRMVGITPEAMKIIVVKSSNHFRADFTPLVGNAQTDIIIAKAAGPMAADPADLPWKHLPASIRRRP